jgi:ABC-type sugar transport system permease subunit
MATAKAKAIISGRKRGKGVIIAFLAPAILVYLIFFIYPSINALKVAMYDWNGFFFETAKFVGLDNFIEAFHDQWVWVALENNLYIMVFGGILMFSAALFFAVVLTRPGFHGKSFYKSTIFLPYVISQVGVALLWIFVLQPRFGMLNTILRGIGLKSLALTWLGSRTPAMGSIIFIIVWSSIGFYMILLMAGIETIPSDLFDAAKVDGASEWLTFRYLTLPLIRDILAIAIVFWMISAIKAFGVVWTLTRGGPANSTNTMATYMMNRALPYQTAQFRMGYATAISVILLILVLGVSMLFFRLQRKEAIQF